VERSGIRRARASERAPFDGVSGGPTLTPSWEVSVPYLALSSSASQALRSGRFVPSNASTLDGVSGGPSL
jgi:hypothetical protein